MEQTSIETQPESGVTTRADPDMAKTATQQVQDKTPMAKSEDRRTALHSTDIEGDQWDMLNKDLDWYEDALFKTRMKLYEAQSDILPKESEILRRLGRLENVWFKKHGEAKANERGHAQSESPKAPSGQDLDERSLDPSESPKAPAAKGLNMGARVQGLENALLKGCKKWQASEVKLQQQAPAEILATKNHAPKDKIQAQMSWQEKTSLELFEQRAERARHVRMQLQDGLYGPVRIIGSQFRGLMTCARRIPKF